MVLLHMWYSLVASCLPNCHLVSLSVVPTAILHLASLRCYYWSIVQLWYPGGPFTPVLRLWLGLIPWSLSNSHLHAWLSHQVFIFQPSRSRLLVAQPSQLRLDYLTLSAKTWLLDSLCQDFYTNDRLGKLRYIHSWNFYCGPVGLLLQTQVVCKDTWTRNQCFFPIHMF